MMYFSVCFLTLLERKVLGYIQNRKGPLKILFVGLFQPVLDGGKLILKSFVGVGLRYYVLSVLSLVIIRMLRMRIFFFSVGVVMNNSIFYFLLLRVFMVYVLFLLG